MLGTSVPYCPHAPAPPPWARTPPWPSCPAGRPAPAPCPRPPPAGPRPARRCTPPAPYTHSGTARYGGGRCRGTYTCGHGVALQTWPLCTCATVVAGFIASGGFAMEQSELGPYTWPYTRCASAYGFWRTSLTPEPRAYIWQRPTAHLDVKPLLLEGVLRQEASKRRDTRRTTPQ